jgi:hypothetical protein
MNDTSYVCLNLFYKLGFGRTKTSKTFPIEIEQPGFKFTCRPWEENLHVPGSSKTLPFTTRRASRGRGFLGLNEHSSFFIGLKNPRMQLLITWPAVLKRRQSTAQAKIKDGSARNDATTAKMAKALAAQNPPQLPRLCEEPAPFA